MCSPGLRLFHLLERLAVGGLTCWLCLNHAFGWEFLSCRPFLHGIPVVALVRFWTPFLMVLRCVLRVSWRSAILAVRSFEPYGQARVTRSCPILLSTVGQLRSPV